MKKIKFYGTFLYLVFLSTSTFAQKSTLPEKVLKTFDKDYSNAEEVVWEVKSKGDYKIKFVQDGKKKVVEITEDGTWEKTSTHLEFNELPKEVQTTVNEQKKSSEIAEIKMITNDKGDTYYTIELTDEKQTVKLEINKKGKIVKSEVK